MDHTIKKNMIISTTLVVLMIFIDQWIKIWVKSNMPPHEPGAIELLSWFRLIYVENEGMAFGTQILEGVTGKLILSIFRLFAVGAIVVYLRKLILEKVHLAYIISVSLILAGALGNIMDSALYDFIFDADIYPSYRSRGFLLGAVVDMFQFTAQWPEGFPVVGGNDVFPAIFNFADACITGGVIIVILFYKKIFPKKKEANDVAGNSGTETNSEVSDQAGV